MSKAYRDDYEDDDEVTRLEKINRELSKKMGDLEDEVRRKNKALEGFIAENEALKKELAGQTAGFAAPLPAPANSDSKSGPSLRVAAKLSKWMKSL